jgi:DNA invertase Pin-like site-specific DNA recombinase
LDRLARSIADARDIADELTAREVKLAFGGQVYDPTDPMGKLVFNMMSVFAEFEADLIRMRTREGMRIAKRDGKLRGKQPKLSAKQEARLVKLYDSGDYSKSELAEMFSVARSTVGRAVERVRAHSPA